MGSADEYDYHDIVYPIPFNRLYNDISTHYIHYGKRVKGLPSFVLTGDIPEFDKYFSDVLMMTGASDNHAYGSFNALYSMVLADPYASYLYIDLGLSDELRVKLFAHFETIHQVQRMDSSRIANTTGMCFQSGCNWWEMNSEVVTRGR